MLHLNYTALSQSESSIFLSYIITINNTFWVIEVQIIPAVHLVSSLIHECDYNNTGELLMCLDSAFQYRILVRPFIAIMALSLVQPGCRAGKGFRD